jgi:hypothetical protein
MRKASFRSAGLALLLAIGLGGGCSLGEEKDDDSPSSGGSGGATAGSGGSIGLGKGGEGGESGAAMTDPGCTELEGLGDCGTMAVQAVFKAVNMMLVVDKSGSMDDVPEGDSAKKWATLREALDIALNNVAGEVNFGMILYPYSATTPIPLMNCTNCCEVADGNAAVNVPIEPGPASIPKILEAIDDTSPGGGTPTAAALARAYEYFSSPAGMALKGERYVLLATDGGPNCNPNNSCDAEHCTANMDRRMFEANLCDSVGPAFCLDDQSVRDQLEQLLSIGVPTFVVGIPGTEQYAQYLDDFAVAGGVPLDGSPRYYAVTGGSGAQALADTLTSITTQLVRSCDIDMGKPPLLIDEVNVAVDCKVVPRVSGEGGAGGDGNASGWDVNPDDPNKLKLRGTLCNWVETNGARRVDVVYGCPTIL